MRLWSRKPRSPIPYKGSLDTPLLRFGRQDVFTTRDAMESIAIFGGMGSGKTSGSARALATAFLRCGYGGLVMCATVNEADRWRQLAAETGRSHSLIFIDRTAERRFNFLDYAQTTLGRDDFNENVVAVFEAIAETFTGSTDNGGENSFFQLAAVNLIRSTLPILFNAYGTLRLKDVVRFIDSAPRSTADLKNREWRSSSFFAQSMFKAHNNVLPGTHAATDIETYGNFWTEQFAPLADKTRTNIIATLNNMLSPFLTGYINRLLCTDTNILPEYSHEGAIIVLNLPTHTDGKVAQATQKIFKYLWQKSVQSRHTDEKTRPVFLWADECQYFISKEDYQFIGTSRERKAANVYITQDMPSYNAAILGCGGSDEEAKALLAKFQTKIFHSNTDETTCDYASSYIGKIKKYNITKSVTATSGMNTGGNQDEGGSGSFGGGGNKSEGDTIGYTEYVDYEVMPTDFGSTLRKGGTPNKKKVDAIIMSTQPFKHGGGKNRLKVTFRQK